MDGEGIVGAEDGGTLAGDERVECVADPGCVLANVGD